MVTAGITASRSNSHSSVFSASRASTPSTKMRVRKNVYSSRPANQTVKVDSDEENESSTDDSEYSYISARQQIESAGDNQKRVIYSLGEQRNLEGSLWRTSHVMLKISLVALFLATIEQELFGATSPNILPDGCPAVVSDVLRALGSLCALSLSCLVVRRYRLMRKLMLMRSSGGDAVSSEFVVFAVDRTLLAPFITELVLNCVHAPPFTRIDFSLRQLGERFTYRVEVFVWIVLFCRCVYLGIRSVRDGTIENNYKAQIFARFNKIEVDTSFAFKIVTSENPLQFLSGATLIHMLTSAYILRLAESPYCGPNGVIAVGPNFGESCNNFQSFVNSTWAAIVTFLTIGYGDMYPHTHFGRFAAIYCVVVGTLIVSLLIALIESILEYSNGEYCVVRVLQREQYKVKVRDKAATCLQAWWRTMTLKKLSAFKDRRQGKQIMRKYHLAVLRYREVKRTSRLGSTRTDHLGKALEDVSHAVHRIESECDHLSTKMNMFENKTALLHNRIGRLRESVANLNSGLKGILKAVAVWELRQSHALSEDTPTWSRVEKASPTRRPS